MIMLILKVLMTMEAVINNVDCEDEFEGDGDW